MKYWFKVILNTQRKRVFYGVAWYYFAVLSAVGLLALSGWLITATALAGIAFLEGAVLVINLYGPGSGIRLFALSRTVSRYVERLYNHETILELISVFRLKLFNKLSKQPLELLRTYSDSEWLDKLTSDLDSLDHILTRYIVATLSSGLLVITVTGLAWFILGTSGLLLGLILFIVFFITVYLTIKQTSNIGFGSAQNLSLAKAELIEHLKGIPSLGCYSLAHEHSERVKAMLNKLNRYSRKLDSNILNITFFLEIFLSLFLISAMIFLISLFKSSLIDGPVLVMSFLVLIAIQEVLTLLPQQLGNWGKTQYSSERLKQLTEVNSDVSSKEVSGIREITVSVSEHPKIELASEQVIQFSLRKNQSALITGASGSGKSTLAKLMMGIEPSKGASVSIKFNSHDIEDIREESLYQHIGYLEQQSYILSESVFYNVALGRPSVSKEDVLDALNLVELSSWAKSLPERLDTWIGESGYKPSGGEIQRIALARIIVKSPPLIILDEPFYGIGYDMSAKIMANLIPWLSKRKCIFFMHHYDPSLAELNPKHINL
ncbi:MAG: ATP-binding cassette domain-containing protein [Kangiellaceae bacterium]|jgi:ATP-binding cassette subfamily C protein CydC|nr:ATP-binding cassette domain-containing protein [Kangiellaceae bacterium]